jgi:hypothetical protein
VDAIEIRQQTPASLVECLAYHMMIEVTYLAGQTLDAGGGREPLRLGT